MMHEGGRDGDVIHQGRRLAMTLIRGALQMLLREVLDPDELGNRRRLVRGGTEQISVRLGRSPARFRGDDEERSDLSACEIRFHSTAMTA